MVAEETTPGVSHASIPRRALNHCVSPSTRETAAIGTPSVIRTSAVMRSKRARAGIETHKRRSAGGDGFDVELVMLRIRPPFPRSRARPVPSRKLGHAQHHSCEANTLSPK